MGAESVKKLLQDIDLENLPDLADLGPLVDFNDDEDL